MAFDYPSGLILPFDTACPSGWTRMTALDDTFVMGASAYGDTGGTVQHRHYVNPVSRNTTAASGTNDDNPTLLTTNTSSTQTHVHAADIATSYSAYKSNYPPYINVVFCQKD